MKPIQRIFTTITSQFDHLVSQVENHEAVAEASLKQLRLDIRNAQVQQRVLQKEIEQKFSQMETCKKEQKGWQQRALRFAEDDRDKALYCMKMFQQGKVELEHLEQSRSELMDSADYLKDQLGRVETQYRDLQVKIRTYQSRDRAAQLKTTPLNPVDGAGSIDQVFSRWDQKIIRKEVNGEDIRAGAPDPYDREILLEEEGVELAIALDELVSANVSKSKQ